MHFRNNYIISQMLEGMQAGVAAVIAVVVYDMAAGIVHGKERSVAGNYGGVFRCGLLF